MSEHEPIVVELPLNGVWTAYHTPAETVPSHGTDQFGQRYAYDFVRIDQKKDGWKFFRSSVLKYHLRGVSLDECYGWGEPVVAPFSGTVVAAYDGLKERNPVQFIKDFAVVIRNGLTFNTQKRDYLPSIAGNYIILKKSNDEAYALFAHGQCGSIRVRDGDEVQCGQHILNVGHSGNSTGPHLHFHLMNKSDIFTARGMPCVFRKYEVWCNGEWVPVENNMPGKREFFRNVA